MGFLDLPYEIRTMIYAEYLPYRKSRPTSTSKKTTAPIDRLARDLAKGHQYRGHAGKWTRLNSPYHHVRNLLVVSRQVYFEVLSEILNRFRISVPNIFELKSDGRPAKELEAVFIDLIGKGQMLKHLEVDLNPGRKQLPPATTSTSTSTSCPAGVVATARQPPIQELTIDSIADLNLNQNVWDCLLPGLASVKINASPARFPHQWTPKILAMLQYVDASVNERCVVEVHAATTEDRKLIEETMTHPRLKVVVQAEEDQEWWEVHGSAACD